MHKNVKIDCINTSDYLQKRGKTIAKLNLVGQGLFILTLIAHLDPVDFLSLEQKKQVQERKVQD